MKSRFCKFNLLNLQNRHPSIFRECEVLVTNGKIVQKITLVNVIHKLRAPPDCERRSSKCTKKRVRILFVQFAQIKGQNFDTVQFAQKFWEKFGIMQIAQKYRQNFVHFAGCFGAVRSQSQPHRQFAQKIKVC